MLQACSACVVSACALLKPRLLAPQPGGRGTARFASRAAASSPTFLPSPGIAANAPFSIAPSSDYLAALPRFSRRHRTLGRDGQNRYAAWAGRRYGRAFNAAPAATPPALHTDAAPTAHRGSPRVIAPPVHPHAAHFTACAHPTLLLPSPTTSTLPAAPFAWRAWRRSCNSSTATCPSSLTSGSPGRHNAPLGVAEPACRLCRRAAYDATDARTPEQDRLDV